MSDPVTYERRGAAAVLTIDRPERRNAIDGPTAGLLTEAYRRFVDDDEARVLVLTGAGELAFCAGADLKAIESFEPRMALEDGPLGFSRLISPKPAIAAISGWCLAGGLELALWCDLRIATEDAKLGFTERRFGVPLVDGGTQRLPRIVGLGRALDMILTGRVVEAEEAHRIGLVTEIVARGTASRARARVRRGARGVPPGHDARRPLRRARGDRPEPRGGHAPRGPLRAPHARDRLGRSVAVRRGRRTRRRRGRRALMPAIEVTDLRKSYGALEALRGVSFTVERGEVFGLLGPNGAGKTTAVEILEGYRRRSAGDVIVLGQDPEDRDRRQQERIGIVLQSCGFYKRASVREAVEHFAKAYPKPRDPGETIALVGLEDKADEHTKHLSGGQRRRLDLALALVGDPELVFLDEPTTGFDPAARRIAWDVVRRLKELEKTVLLTTHYLDEAQELADRVAIVKDGAIVAQGPPDDLGPGSSHYRVSYVSQGRRVEHQTDDPTDLLHRLTRDALARGERLDGLEVARPTLEEVYLELTHEADSA